MAPITASAHTFLTRSSPQSGARLGSAPGEAVLDFSEPVARSPRLVLRDSHDAEIVPLSIELKDEGRRMRASLPPLANGVYQVTWSVEADDGHVTEGEFVFAVGVAVPTGATLSTATTGGSTRWLDALAMLTLLIGLALALGGLLSETLIWTRSGAGRKLAPVTGATVAALGGALFAFGRSLDRRGVLADPGQWADAATTRSDRALVAIIAAVALALLLVQRRRLRAVGLVPLIIASALVAVAGHVPEVDGWWATPATALHILVGGAWVGALVHLCVTARRDREASSIEPGPRRYARAALVAVAATMSLGVMVAISQLNALGDLTGTRYGRILLVKLGLVAVALVVALLARRRGLPARGQRIRRLARYTTIEAGVLASVLTVSAVLAATAPARGERVFELGPEPLRPPVVVTAELAGSHQVLVAAGPDRLQVNVLPPGGQPDRDQTASFTGREPASSTFDIQPRTCGAGCYEIAHHWSNGTTRLTATVTGSDAVGGSAELVVTWPPGPDGTGLLDGAVTATKIAGTVEITETVSSGPGATVGPNQLGTNGDVYIDASPFGNGADHVHRLPDDNGLKVISFIVTGAGTWHQLWIDDRNRIRRELLIDPGHRVDRTLTYPDPPR